MNKNNIVFVLIGVLILLIIGQNYYFDYKLNKSKKVFEAEIGVLKDSLISIDIRQGKLIEDSRNYTKKASNNKKAINDKQKKDEQAIDDSVISDNDIADFLSKYND